MFQPGTWDPDFSLSLSSHIQRDRYVCSTSKYIENPPLFCDPHCHHPDQSTNMTCCRIITVVFLTRCHNSLPDSTLPFQAVLNTAARMIFLNWNQNLLPFCPSLSRRRSPVLPMPRGPEWSASCSTALMVLPPLPFLLIASARLATWMFLEYTCLKARSSHLPDTHVVSRHCRSSLKCLLSQNVAFSDHLILNCN